MNDILARRARRATVGIALSAALVAGIAPVTAIAAETSSPTGAAVSQTSATNGNSGAPQTEDAAAAKEKAYAAMQEALKNLEAAKNAASPEKIARFNDDITRFQEYREKMAAQAAEGREPLPAMQADVDEAQAKYDEAHNRTSGLQAELNKAIDDGASNETIKQLRGEIMSAERREKSCEDDLHRCQRRLESQEKRVQYFESEAEEAKAHIDEDVAKRDALLGDLEKAQAAYDDACKAYEEAKAAADKATSPEITKPTETTPPLRLNATRRGDTARCLTCNRQRRPTKLHQAGELERRQASRYDRRQAREHGRCSAERNRTRSSRRRRPRNNRHSHTPPQELKIAAKAYYLRQSTSPETKRGPFPHLGKRTSLTAKIQTTAPPPLKLRSHQCPDNASEQQKARD